MQSNEFKQPNPTTVMELTDHQRDLRLAACYRLLWVIAQRETQIHDTLAETPETYSNDYVGLQNTDLLPPDSSES